jgi:DNA polymerase-3 subunit delta
MPFLGGDRQASRNEVRKLALYAQGGKQVTVDDVLAVVADASALALDGVVDAAFAGRLPDVETQYGKARSSGTAPGTIVSAATRQAAQLHKMLLAARAGASLERAMDAARLHFRRKPLVEAALMAWTLDGLARAMQQLNEAVLQTRREPDLADAIANRALTALALAARRKR